MDSGSEADYEAFPDYGSEADYEAFEEYEAFADDGSEAAVDSGLEADSEAVTNSAPQATFIPRAPGHTPWDDYMFTIEEIVHIFLRHEYDDDEERSIRFLSIVFHWPDPEAGPISKGILESDYIRRARNHNELIVKKREWRQINEWFCEDDFTPTWRPMQLERQRQQAVRFKLQRQEEALMQETDEPVAVDHSSISDATGAVATFEFILKVVTLIFVSS